MGVSGAEGKEDEHEELALLAVRRVPPARGLSTGSDVTTAITRAERGACCAADDERWGRYPAARPPLRPSLLAVVATAVGLALVLVVVLVVRGPGPLDDPDPAYQRDGLLLDGPRLPESVEGVRFGGRPVVLLFERTEPSGPAFDAWRSAASDDGVDLVVRVAPAGAELARTLGMRQPVDGGPPVGYAVVDPDRQVRYATLDPSYPKNTFEVDVITGAVA